MLGVSRGTLTKAFKELKGTTPAAYLKATQLEHAKELLRGGSSTRRAGREAGYGTKRTFLRSFRAGTGTTPSTFKSVNKMSPRQR
jgi:AraC-like DNA-binding protein